MIDTTLDFQGIAFLQVYPYPSFILEKTKLAEDRGASWQLVWQNDACSKFLLGDEEDIEDEKTATNKDSDTVWKSLGRSFADLEQLHKFTDWLDGKVDGAIALTMRPVSWTVTSEPSLMTLVKTTLPLYIIVTTTPLQSNSKPISSGTASRRASTGRRDFGLRLPNFPPPPFLQTASAADARFDEEKPLVRRHINHGEMRRLISAFDWESAGLPAHKDWPQSLRSAISFVLAAPYAAALWWGKDLVLMYNDAYALMSGNKHPHILGLKGLVSFRELDWAVLGPLMEKVMGGETVAKFDDLLFFDKLGPEMRPEETYHCWSWTPIEQEDGAVGGVVNFTFESTPKVIAERRLHVLRDLGDHSATSKNENEYSRTVIDILKRNPKDVPFAALYHCSADSNNEPQRPHSLVCDNGTERQISLAPLKITIQANGAFGVPLDNPYLLPKMDFLLDPLSLKSSPEVAPLNTTKLPSPSSLDSDEGLVDSIAPSTDSPSDVNTIRPRDNDSERKRPSPEQSVRSGDSPPIAQPFEWPFAECFSTRKPIHVENLPSNIAETLQRGIWGDIVREALVIPIAPEGEKIPTAVLVLGCNPRRPYDLDYSTWISVLMTTVSNGWSAAQNRAAEIQRVQQLQSLDAAKTVFFSNASHELRTPLTLIAGPLEDSLSYVTDERAKASLKLALRNVSRLARLVDSLMDFSRLEAGRLQGSFKPARLGLFTLDLATLFRQTIERNNIEYEVDIDSSDDQICYVDPELWEKICFNLIGNAFKYTLEGSIKVSLQFREGQAVLSVSDTGVGIPLSEIERIGERFYRMATISRSQEGTGIGLSLTRELIKLHGGTLTVASATADESQDGHHGSTFTVKIPLGYEHLPRALIEEKGSAYFGWSTYGRSVVDEANQWGRMDTDSQTPSESSESGGSEGSRMDPSVLFFSRSDMIMVVDDNSEMRRYIKSLFTPYCKVTEAIHGKEALELTRDAIPDLIITDQMMPFLDGYGLLDALRRNSSTGSIPVILLTAQVGDDSHVDGLLRGFDEFVKSLVDEGRELIARVHLQMQIGKKRRQLEIAFKENTREIQRLSDLSPVGIYRADAEGRITYVNARWRDLSGHPSSSPLDEWLTSVEPQDSREVERMWRAALDDHQPGKLEMRWRNGRWTQFQIEPLHGPTGKFVGVLGALTDTSERRMYEAAQLSHAQEREANARKRMEEAEQRRNEADERRRSQELLIDVTSHEIRQPVSAILNCSALVRSNIISLRQQLWEHSSRSTPFIPNQELIKVMDEDLEALDAIYQCGLAQERIANDVLSLSRIQLHVLAIYPVEFTLVSEVERIISIFRNEVKMKRIGLSLSVGDSIANLGIWRVKTDKARFAQVITNLLSNAIKFTDTSDRERDIHVSLDLSLAAPPEGPCKPPNDSNSESIDWSIPRPVFIFVSVRDSGPGVKPGDLALLFKRFAQGTNSHEVFGGSGLGLFVSRQLCELMGGRVDVESIYGQGATFRFFIRAEIVGPRPIHQSDTELLKASSYHSSSTLGVSPSEPEIGYRPLHILITEDNLINQTVLNRQLRKEGCTTALASNGAQAIEQLKSLIRNPPTELDKPKHFDAVLMDCEMPVMDGLTAVRKIRSMEASGELPRRHRIFALTGNAREAQVQNARAAGMDDVFIKPYRIDDLMQKLLQ